jgi:hypothetical protein
VEIPICALNSKKKVILRNKWNKIDQIVEEKLTMRPSTRRFGRFLRDRSAANLNH